MPVGGDADVIVGMIGRADILLMLKLSKGLKILLTVLDS